ncbi:hypothetical protein KC19_VG294800 [Ceratodon purpureus]|uniref:Uncharacterized protein n=1 Tax=Ceratodon purpureus TaxID=3225 RepID=A0A8T0HWI8_CERPU|nr:hypothetical protein KC19_VG294800 [Ceratodon purpureus]
MDLNWNRVREVEKFIQSFEVEEEEGIGHVDRIVAQTENGLDLLSGSVEILPVEVLTVKGKVPGKKPKFVPGNSLKRYFCSSRNVENGGSLWMPKNTTATSTEALISASSVPSSSCSNPTISVASSSRSNPAVKLVSVSPQSNVAVKLVCPGGLPNLAPLPKELEEVIDLDVEDEHVRKKKQCYENHCKFQDSWVAKTPWAEMMVGTDGEYHSVKGIICLVVTDWVKLLAPKLDTILKHAGRRKAKKDLPHLGVKEGEFYVSENCKHAANTRLYRTRSKDSVELLVVKGMRGERARKKIQFAVIFHLLSQGRPMLEYEASHSLFKYLLVPGLPKLHWSDNSGWEMADAMLKQVLKQNRVDMQSSNFLSMSCDEVTTIDNQSWISIHVYYMCEWR